MPKRNSFINLHERLFIWNDKDDWGEHFSYSYQLEHPRDAVAYCCKYTTKILRIDADFINIDLKLDDVTELVAEDYLTHEGYDPDDLEIEYMPWLQNSQALKDYIENYEEDPNAYDEHSTHNHPQQGTSRIRF